VHDPRTRTGGNVMAAVDPGTAGAGAVAAGGSEKARILPRPGLIDRMPASTRSPMRSGCRGVPRSTAFSMITQPAPT